MALSIAGAVAITWRLDVASLQGDELYYRRAALDMLEGRWGTNAQHPPLAKELMALAHAILGDGVLADRLPSALASWGTGLLLAALVWRAGRPGPLTTLAGPAAALLWWCLPFAPARTALLEAPMLFFLVAAQLAWVTAAVRRDPRWFLAGGALAGLAAAGKLTGATALVGALPAAWLLLRASEAPPARRTLTHLAGGLAAAVAAYLLTYLPMGAAAPEHLATPVTFQLEHAADGHPVIFRGEVMAQAPWWAPFGYQAEALGLWATVALWGAALVGAARHRRRLSPVWGTLAALVVVLVASPLKLGHYQYAWWPLLVVLAVAAVVPPRSAPDRSVAGRWIAAVVALALVPVAATAVDHVRSLRTIEVSGYRLAAQYVEEVLDPEETVVVWADLAATRAALPEQRLSARLPADLEPRALLYDARLAARREGNDLALWERCRTGTYVRRDLGSVSIYLRDDEIPPSPPAERPAECSGLAQH